ncbi:MAG: DUF4157 domain-containing protein, partial [Desulforhabdus sp.]|nr:DUF4157 domain-containing protein [Desulforhabdus sp.]
MECPVQPKLKIGAPKDMFEQEADRVADRVMTMPGTLPHQSTRNTPGNKTLTGLIQREPEDPIKPNDRTSRKEEYNKAELEFHSALHFNRTFSGFNPKGEPKEGEYSIIWYSVWNTGWKTAPEHTDRLTIYNADLCSGCRDEKDNILRSEMRAPSIVSGDQPGQSEYENSFLVGAPLQAGHYEAYVELDVHNEVDEINEDNNSAFMVFVVRPGDQSGSAVEGEGETVQKSHDASRMPAVEPHPVSRISFPKGQGQPLPLSLREFFEPRLGYEFSQVRIHSDARAAEDAKTLHAKAFTAGGDLVFGEGQYAPEKP